MQPEAPLPVVTTVAAAVYWEAEDDLSERCHVTSPLCFSSNWMNSSSVTKHLTALSRTLYPPTPQSSPVGAHHGFDVLSAAPCLKPDGFIMKISLFLPPPTRRQDE